MIIKLTNIKKSYRDGENRLNHVLRDINMEVEKGEFVAVKGPSGCGKTTLLSILGTLLQADAGSYLLNDAPMTASGMDHAWIRNRQIGFVFQDHRLMPQYTVLENVLLPTLAYQSQSSDDEIEYARRLLDLTHISGTADQYPHTLSGGEASRVALCRALIMRPSLVLGDEPTGQLDSENARNIASLLSEINQTLQTTVVMVTHSDEISVFAERILLLKNGVIL
jgi:ABC-type lipoprotein export system ATPase subunit